MVNTGSMMSYAHELVRLAARRIRNTTATKGDQRASLTVKFRVLLEYLRDEARKRRDIRCIENDVGQVVVADLGNCRLELRLSATGDDDVLQRSRRW